MLQYAVMSSEVVTKRGKPFRSVLTPYEAEDVSGRHSVKTCLREQLAKIAALIDVVIRRQPKFLGSLEEVPE